MTVIQVNEGSPKGNQWERARAYRLIRYRCGGVGSVWHGGLWETEEEARRDAYLYLAFAGPCDRVALYILIVDRADRVLENCKIAEVWPTLLF